MKNTWLILDSPYLCWRSYHTTGHLTYKEIPTGIVYGYLRSLLDLQNLFMTENVVHCFDRGRSIRKEMYPEYKSNRFKDSEDEATKLLMFEAKTQINQLRKEYLPELGVKNVISNRGYEADDMIASVCKNLPDGDKGIIISSDHDLYQLLDERVSMYDPRQKLTVTPKSFTEEWGILPSQWPVIKAMAGCHSDNIKGIKGIGGKTACKFIQGNLKESSKKYKSIIEGEEIWKTNLPLVKLPLDGTEVVSLVENDKMSRVGWEKLTKRLGMNSIGNLHRNLPFERE